jgi:hypothetical protein
MTPSTDILLLKKDLKEMAKDIKEVKELVKCADGVYLKKEVFSYEKKEIDDRLTKLEKLVYGAVGLALLTTGEAVLRLVTVVKAGQ